MNKGKKLTFTVGISTRRAPYSILESAKSIRASLGVVPGFRFLVAADFMPPAVRQELEALNVEIVEIREEKTLAEKFKVLLAQTTDDIFFLTQDDVICDPHLFSHLLQNFESNASNTFLCAHIVSLRRQGLFQFAVQIGTRIAYRIGRAWNHGNNYLLANGRCIALRTNFAKKFIIPDNITNLDAYLYFINRMNGGSFASIDNAIVYINVPGSLKDYLSQTSRFQYSYQEISRYLPSVKYETEYKVPFSAALRATIAEFLRHPAATSFYSALYFYTRINRNKPAVAIDPLWKEETSTKHAAPLTPSEKPPLGVTIGIPAYNEEKNIANMLDSVMRQTGGNFRIEEIIVAIDGATDRTEAIVENYARRYPAISIFLTKHQGKMANLELIYKKNRSDILFTFDADIVLKDEHVIERVVKVFQDNPTVAFAACHQIPYPATSFVGKILEAGNRLWEETRIPIRGGEHIHNLQGSATAMRNIVAKNVSYPPTITSDSGYLYMSAKRFGRFCYMKDAAIIYQPPNNLYDFRLLSSRAIFQKRKTMFDHFGESIFEEYYVPLRYKLAAISKRMLASPVYTALAILLNILVEPRERGASYDGKGGGGEILCNAG